MEISKELLTGVLEKEIREFVIEKNELRYILENDTNSIPEPYYINIYELANKCKEWAFEFRFDNKPTNNRYYGQRSGYEDKFNVEKQKREKLGYMTLTFGCLGHTKTFYADTEPEAIFKACQWILENKTNKEG